MADEEEEDPCPLCMEPLDVTDQAASLCGCGYRMCLWCWHRIMEDAAKENLPGRCPNCREPYDKERITQSTVDPDKIAEAQQRKKDEKKKSKLITDKKALTNVRVIQRNLVYVVGLSMNLCREDVLRKQDFFGQFGKIVKISVNRNSPYSSVSARQMPTGSAYVTFFRPNDAMRCIECIDGAIWDGRPIRACFGTTKYCNSFLKGIPCTNPDCLYLHEINSDENDNFTKEQMLARYGSSKGNFFDVGHPKDQRNYDYDRMELYEAEMREDLMRSQAQNIPNGPSPMGPGRLYGQPSPPGSSGLGMLGGYGAIGGGSGMGSGGSSSGMGIAGPSSGNFPPGAYGDAVSWGQVAASGKTPPPPPPPQPATAVEEWPELGAGPGPAAAAGPSSVGSGKMSRSGSGRMSRSGLEPQASNGKSVDSLDGLSGIAVAKPAIQSKGHGAPGSNSNVFALGSGPLPSPFLSAAGTQASGAPAKMSGMVTMSIPNPQGAVVSSRPGSAAQRAPGSGPVSKPPPPGFGAPTLGITQPSSSASLQASGQASVTRGPPPGFGPSSNASAGSVATGNGSGNHQMSGSLDNDTLSNLVDCLKNGLIPTDLKTSEPFPQTRESSNKAKVDSPELLAQALQGLDLLAENYDGLSEPGKGPFLPPGIDVWSEEVPPAFAGLATAGYNPMGLRGSGADSSARYLLRNAHALSSSASLSSRHTSVDSSDGSTSHQTARSQSRFQFARSDDANAARDSSGMPAAIDVSQLFKHGGASLRGAPPGFGLQQDGERGIAEISNARSGALLLQQLTQMHSKPDNSYRLLRPAEANAGQGNSFVDPAIILSGGHGIPQSHLSGANSLTAAGSAAVRPPPGFGGAVPPQQQRTPLFARGSDWHLQQQRQQSSGMGEGYSSWESR